MAQTLEQRNKATSSKNQLLQKENARLEAWKISLEQKMADFEGIQQHILKLTMKNNLLKQKNDKLKYGNEEMGRLKLRMASVKQLNS